MKQFVIAFAAAVALLMSCQAEIEKEESLSGESYRFDFTITPGGFDNATKGDATVGWTAGEKVYVFFKPEGGELLGDSYAEFTYTGSGWNPESYVAAGALGASGKMAAVYVPYFDGKSPVYTGSKWTFDSGDVYYSCASGADYIVKDGTVRGTLSMRIPDGYVQFAVDPSVAAEGEKLECNLVDAYEGVTLSSELVFSSTPVIDNRMTGHADNGKVYFWGRMNSTVATDCKFTLTTSAEDMVLKTLAGNVKKNGSFNLTSFKPAMPDGALPGKFSVSASKQVRFSQGNLVATVDADGAPTAWKFADKQFGFIEKDGANETIGSASGDVDLFGWSTPSTAYGINTSKSNGDYSGSFNDWGMAYCTANNIAEGTWRTLSINEWQYLFSQDGSESGGANYDNDARRGKFKCGVTVCGVACCLVILPDGWTWNASTVGEDWQTEYPESGDDVITWKDMEEAGAVCFSPAGYRSGSSVPEDVNIGYYWASEEKDSEQSCLMHFTASDLNVPSSTYRYTGRSVRLVTDVTAPAPK